MKKLYSEYHNPPPPILIRRHEIPDYAGVQKPIMMIYIEKSLYIKVLMVIFIVMVVQNDKCPLIF